MDPERQREIARKGGASVPSEKRSFSQDRSLAAQAGRKGGEAVSQDREHMAEIGSKGGQASGGNRQGNQGGNQGGNRGGSNER